MPKNYVCEKKYMNFKARDTISIFKHLISPSMWNESRIVELKVVANIVSLRLFVLIRDYLPACRGSQTRAADPAPHYGANTLYSATKLHFISTLCCCPVAKPSTQRSKKIENLISGVSSLVSSHQYASIVIPNSLFTPFQFGRMSKYPIDTIIHWHLPILSSQWFNQQSSQVKADSCHPDRICQKFQRFLLWDRK